MIGFEITVLHVHARRMVHTYKHVLIICGNSNIVALGGDPSVESIPFDLYYIPWRMTFILRRTS